MNKNLGKISKKKLAKILRKNHGMNDKTGKFVLSIPFIEVE